DRPLRAESAADSALKQLSAVRAGELHSSSHESMTDYVAMAALGCQRRLAGRVKYETNKSTSRINGMSCVKCGSPAAWCAMCAEIHANVNPAYAHSLIVGKPGASNAITPRS